MKHSPRKTKGVTLIELLVTLSIFALLWFLGAPNLTKTYRIHQQNLIFSHLENTLAQARLSALYQKQTMKIVPHDLGWGCGWKLYANENLELVYHLRHKSTLVYRGFPSHDIIVFKPGGRSSNGRFSFEEANDTLALNALGKSERQKVTTNP